MRAAYRIADALTDTEIVSMRCDPEEVPAGEADMIGFVSPVYHWTLPEAVIQFIKGLQINPDAYIFAVSTPSLINGHVFEVLDGILKEKNASLSYGKILYSVANLVIAYPPFPSPKMRVPRTEKKLTSISEDIVGMKKNKYPKAFVLTRMLYSTIMPKYRRMLHDGDKGFVVTDKCVSCGTCVKVCPRRNIIMEDKKLLFSHQCSFCMACVSYCPVEAITYTVNAEMKEKYKYKYFFIRILKLPSDSRKKRYHNPFISVADMAADRQHINGVKQQRVS